MKPMTYKHITVEEREWQDPKRTTKVFRVTNNRSCRQIGQIAYEPRWRQFVFHPSQLTIWSAGYLADIQDAIAKITADHRAAHPRKTRSNAR